MSRHVVSIDTAKTLLIAKSELTWRQFAVSLGYDESYFATLNAASRRIPGAMSKEAERELCARLGMAPKARKRYRRPCMTDAEYVEYQTWKAER